MPIKNYNIVAGIKKTGYNYKSINKAMNTTIILPAQINNMANNINNYERKDDITNNNNFKYYSDTESEPEY